MERLKAEMEERKRREERERVWKVAPGFDAQTTLVPKKVGQSASANTGSVSTDPLHFGVHAPGAHGGPHAQATLSEDRMMADLVESLAKLDAAHSLG